jgi:hypothetical protein
MFKEERMNEEFRQALEAYGAAWRAFCNVAARHQRGEATDEELRQARLAMDGARETWQEALRVAGVAMPSCVK